VDVCCETVSTYRFSHYMVLFYAGCLRTMTLISEMMATVLWIQVLSNGSLAVSEVYMEDSGMYGCTAENSGGPRRTEVHLQVTSEYPLNGTDPALFYHSPTRAGRFTILAFISPFGYCRFRLDLLTPTAVTWLGFSTLFVCFWTISQKLKRHYAIFGHYTILPLLRTAYT